MLAYYHIKNINNNIKIIILTVYSKLINLEIN